MNKPAAPAFDVDYLLRPLYIYIWVLNCVIYAASFRLKFPVERWAVVGFYTGGQS